MCRLAVPEWIQNAATVISFSEIVLFGFGINKEGVPTWTRPYTEHGREEDELWGSDDEMADLS